MLREEVPKWAEVVRAAAVTLGSVRRSALEGFPPAGLAEFSAADPGVSAVRDLIDGRR